MNNICFHAGSDAAASATLASVLDRLETLPIDSNLKAALSRDVRRACKWFNATPADISADPARVMARFRRVSPGGLNISKKRFANVRSSLRLALRLTGFGTLSTRLVPLLPEYSHLLEAATGRYASMRLVRFFRFLSGLNTRPHQVTQEMADGFLRFIEDEGVVKSPKRVHREAMKTANYQLENVPGWPMIRFDVPFYNDKYMLTETSFPDTFVADVDKFLANSSSDDPFDLSGRDHPLKGTTIPSYRDRIFRMASLAVLSGHAIVNLRSLADLVKLDIVREGLRYLSTRREHTPKAQCANIAWLMMQISRDFVVWDDPVEGKENSASLLKLAKRLDNERGLKQATRERLHALKDQQNLARLLLLPHAVLRPMKRIKSPTRREALEYSLGLVLMILTYCPLRIGSLCSLRIDKHLKWSKPDMRGELLICFERGELKNGEPCDLPLPPDCAAAIRTFILQFRPLLLTCRSPFLLPSIHDNKPKWKSDVARQLKALIFDRTGFTVNSHLFRHIVHLVVLDRFPGPWRWCRGF